MKTLLTLFTCGLFAVLHAQDASLSGVVQDAEGEMVAYANIGLFAAADSSLAKAGITDEQGQFVLQGLQDGQYFLKVAMMGYSEYVRPAIQLPNTGHSDLGLITLSPDAIALETATITATRAMVEVKPDRTVFNVQGTINSVGNDGMALLRKAPGVTVDNNDNISVLGRSGVIIYVDGKRLPLSGQDLSLYLQNLTAEQIDRIEIISNPGARYEAEGNAGIIDIRLKRDKQMGANGSINSTASQGIYHRANLSGTGNYRNKLVNLFGNAGIGNGAGFNNMKFFSYLNDLVQDEINLSRNQFEYYNYRVGADFFLGKNHTLGILTNGSSSQRTNRGYNRITLAQQATPSQIDSILIANSTAMMQRSERAFNLNYQMIHPKGRTLTIDLDYGNYRNDTDRDQPNLYYDAAEETVLTSLLFYFNTPTNIDIYTAQLDFEDNLWGGKLGLGGKLSKVVSDNIFLVYDGELSPASFDERLSNTFLYDEQVSAAYLTYARPLGKKWNMTAGLRAEHTDAMGELQAFSAELQEPPVVFNYTNLFPNIGLTWQMAPDKVWQFSAGRRINRPDYNVLNPFNNYLSQLSYEKGNPFLRPEIVNNAEIGFGLAYRYHFKLSYSRTTDQITRLIAPDENDPRAGFITWDNLASQTTIGFNVSAPFQISKKWSAYFNISASHIDNQADYGEGAVVDVQAFTYSIYQQQTIELPWGLTGEISGYYSGPGIWGGVFLYESNWGLDMGLQRKFLRDRLNVKVSVSDIFYETGWDGYSDFAGLYSYGSGRWDSRRGAISLSYMLGNQSVKSRNRKTGIESEAARVGNE